MDALLDSPSRLEYVCWAVPLAADIVEVSVVCLCGVQGLPNLFGSRATAKTHSVDGLSG